METAILEYQSEVEKVKKELPQLARDILIRNVNKVLKIIKEDQLSEGKDSSGKVVGRYSRATEQFASDPYNTPRQPKEAGQPYNFEWTGGLFDNMHLFFEDMKSYSIFSADEKALFLQKVYGDIFTMTEANNDRVNNEIILPELIEYMVKRLI
ncbi:hypothetical protein [Joostella sp. CR20]|uniref:hypothetical protein n=1 Tax=Joostella sp. CR20 TaxID=2804312 RepID=UPI00313B7042